MKLREMILYIVENARITSFEQLCFVLYLCDLEAYHELGKSISGVAYTRGKSFPEPVGIRELLTRMFDEGSLNFSENFLSEGS